MRAGLLIYGSLDTRSGGYLYDRTLVEHLRQRGDQVEIFSLPWRSYTQHLGDNFSPDLFQRLNQLQVDVLIQDELNHPSLFALNWRLQALQRYPIVSLVHHLRGSEDHPPAALCLYRWVENHYLRSVDAFIFNSQTTCRVVAKKRSPLPSHIIACPAGDRLAPQISTAEIKRRAFQPGPLRLFFLGNVIRRKGLHTLIESCARLDSSTWTLQVAGNLDMEPGYARQVRERVRQLGLAGQVHFWGPLDDDRLVEVMRSQHVLVLPSFYEGYGIAYLEGMSFGLPAIASTGGAAHEIITHAQDGYLIHPGDDLALAGHLKTLAEDRTRLAAMGTAARQRYLAQPGWPESMEQIRTFLLTLL